MRAWQRPAAAGASTHNARQHPPPRRALTKFLTSGCTSTTPASAGVAVTSAAAARPAARKRSGAAGAAASAGQATGGGGAASLGGPAGRARRLWGGCRCPGCVRTARWGACCRGWESPCSALPSPGHAATICPGAQRSESPALTLLQGGHAHHAGALLAGRDPAAHQRLALRNSGRHHGCKYTSPGAGWLRESGRWAPSPAHMGPRR